MGSGVKLGFDIELIHDVHERISPNRSHGFCERIRTVSPFLCGKMYCPWIRLNGLEKIRMSTTTPLAEGEII